MSTCIISFPIRQLHSCLKFFLLGGSNLQFIDFSTISWLIQPLHFNPYSDKKVFSQQLCITIPFSLPIFAKFEAIWICSFFVGGLKSGAFLFTFFII